MPKKKAVNANTRRLKDKLRKREKRLQKSSSSATSHDEMSTESTVSCGSVDGADSAPPSNFLGQVSMGFPLKEEKPLARVQASPRVKMHPTAPRLPSPRGSRLFVREQDKAPSPDSPAWVCAPARAPGPDPEHGSGPAGQAQLEGFREERTSRNKKDEGNLNETKTETERNMNRNLNETEIEHSKPKINDTFFTMKDASREIDCDSQATLEIHNEQNQTRSVYNRSVQGSFHQGNVMFGENAGTQCVANCLGAVAYHKLKNTEYWDMSDMNIVLTTGNELYTYLQRSSTISSRYLLVSELPQFVECFDKIFEFRRNESLASLINLGICEPCYEDFNAYTLIDALQISLSDCDACFACFGGNTFLVGKTRGKYFIFDSHSRTREGNQTADGTSIRVIYDGLFDVQQHILSLALSMGYANFVECEITGVVCSMMHVGESVRTENFQNKVSFQSLKHDERSECHSNLSEILESNDSVEYLSEEKATPVDALSLEGKLGKAGQREICQELNLTLSEETNDPNTRIIEIEGTKMHTRDIIEDGNCFFRAISCCVSGSENNHDAIRQATCSYMLENENLFKSLQRNMDISINEYLQRSNMSESGTWATELEIIAVASMLKINVYTYSCGRWLLYAETLLNQDSYTVRGSVFLHHINRNHYNVVSEICKSSSLKKVDKKMENYRRRLENMREKYWGNAEYRKKILDKKKQAYHEDSKLKKYSLRKDKQRHDKFKTVTSRNRREKYSTCPQYQRTIKEINKQRYKTNISHQKSLKSASISKYRFNPDHKKLVRKASIHKYRVNPLHRQHVKESSIRKYKSNEIHRQAVKNASIEKYKVDLVHQKAVKNAGIKKYKENPVYRQALRNASVLKYKSDLNHQTTLKRVQIEKYKKDPQYQMRKKEYEVKRYQLDEKHRENVKARSADRYANPSVKKEMLESRKRKYECNEDNRNKKKNDTRKSRRSKKAKLENEFNVNILFKKKSKEFPDYVCCCCHRLLFVNQVHKCDIELYESKCNAKNIAEICIQKDYLHSCSESCPSDCTRSSLWICKTCHRKILCGNIPAEAAVNRMKLERLPKELENLNSLERQLISLHIPFMRITNLPQGRQRNIHGPVVCVPADLNKATCLPRTGDESMVLRVKLKRKLSYKGYQEYQFVHPHHLSLALNFLITNNEWYKDVQVDTNANFSDCFIERNESEADNDEQEELHTELEDINAQAISDTCLQPVDVVQEVLCHYFDDVYSLAPGEGKNPVKILQENGNEAKTFPCLFPSGRNTWNENRDVRITLSRYFHKRLMNADNSLGRDSNYIFFS